MELSILLLLAAAVSIVTSKGILFPRESETREVKTIDGIWKFSTSKGDIGFNESWFSTFHKEWINMPVPSSFNDVTVNSEIRDFVGWAWYQTRFISPKRWKDDNQSVFIRFGDAHYVTEVWLNGEHVGEHVGGHLPFAFDVTDLLEYGQPNLLTVAINNTLTNSTLPQGSVHHYNDTEMYPPDYTVYDYPFDFYNYAGIHRPVYLYTTPQSYIDDITVVTEVNGTSGIVQYEIESILGSNGVDMEVLCEVTLLDDSGSTVAKGSNCQDQLEVENPTLWWPVGMNDTVAYLYTLQVKVSIGESEDVYRLPVGIRSLSWDSGLKINSVPVYLKGFGKHEDSNLRGKGLDYALLLRDHSLIEWVGANCYRTSHYPYSEESMDLADSLGIMIIDESPAVDLDLFDQKMLDYHKIVMSELIKRDKNRPSIIMWSLTNEARTYQKTAGPYYKELANYVRSIDPTRPVTMVTNQDPNKDYAAEHVDIIGVNRYYSWYIDTGVLSLIPRQVENDLTKWYNKFSKPIFMTEYGADAVAGLHSLPAVTWTEDYQAALLHQHFIAFDKLRDKGFFIGEMIWNFADFATKQSVSRVVGNRKGIFTRERQPKESAYILRNRYRKLSEGLDETCR